MELFIEAEPDVLTALFEVARIQSTGASNRIEGVYTTDERLKAIVQEKVQLYRNLLQNKWTKDEQGQ